MAKITITQQFDNTNIIHNIQKHSRSSATNRMEMLIPQKNNNQQEQGMKQGLVGAVS